MNTFPNRSLRMFALGVIVTAAFAVAALWALDYRWKMAAWEHNYSVWYWDDVKNGKLKWSWKDDYIRKQMWHLFATPTPQPKYQRGKLEKL